MPGSKNKAGTRVSHTEQRKAKIIAIQKIEALFRQDKQSAKRFHGHFFGRFSANNRKIRFYIESEHDQKKLDAILATHSILFPKITPIYDLEPTDYERVESITLQLSEKDSPIKIYRQNVWTSPSHLTVSHSVRDRVEKNKLHNISLDIANASVKAEDAPEMSMPLMEYFQSKEAESVLDAFDFSDEELWPEYSSYDEDSMCDTDSILTESEDGIKFMSAIITPETLREAQKNRRQRNTNLFGLSAEAYAALEKTSNGQKRLEFLHLLAHAFAGEFEKNNIVIGSWCANTIMLMYDSAAKKLLEQHGCTEIKISIECRMQPKIHGEGYTEHAAQIKMVYETDTGFKFESPIIDANSEKRPSTAEHKGIEAIVIGGYLASKQPKIPPSISQTLPQTSTPKKENIPNQNTPQPQTPFSHTNCSFFRQNIPAAPPKISVRKPLPFNSKFG